MRVRWLPESLRDIERLYDFLINKDPNAAIRAMEVILDGADGLADMPEIGKPMSDDAKRRELYLPFGTGAYILRYKLDGDAAVIIRVWHSREYRGLM